MENPEERLPPVNFDKLAVPALKPATTAGAVPASSLLNKGYYGGYTTEESQTDGRSVAHDPPAERPVGVTIVAVLNFLAVALYAFLLLVALQEGGRESGNVVFVSIIAIALGLVIGVGLWRLKAWGYMLALIGYSISLVSNVIGNFNEELTGRSLLSILIPLAIIAYLLQRDVHEAFENY